MTITDFLPASPEAKLQKFKLTLWLSTNNLIFLSLRISLARFWYALNLEIYLLNLALSNSSNIRFFFCNCIVYNFRWEIFIKLVFE